MHDVIVVGSRVAGASTALLLARQGLDVLAVDRASFPSETLSSHQVQVPAVARLARWGILGALEGTPPARRVRFDTGGVVLDAAMPVVDGADALLSPRRSILDTAPVDAARAAGADVRERCTLEEVVLAGGRVTGVRVRERGGASVLERARLVVGADGRHSAVARAVGAGEYDARPARSCAFYAYWSGMPLAGGEIYARPG